MKATSLLAEIPEWILKYNKRGYQSSAGKAIDHLIRIIASVDSDPPWLKVLYSGQLYSEYLILDIEDACVRFRDVCNDDLDTALERLMRDIKDKGFSKTGIPHKDGERILWVGHNYCIVEILHD